MNLFIPEDIKVSLSTSKFSPIPTDNISKQFTQLNLPICVAEQYIIITSKQIEKTEHIIAESTKSMVKEIFIDKHSIFIGINHNDEATGLIIYSAQNPNKFEIEFFKRWNEIQSLLFEFQVFNQERKNIFTIKGLWLKDRWQFLDSIPNSLIIIKDKDDETI